METTGNSESSSKKLLKAALFHLIRGPKFVLLTAEDHIDRLFGIIGRRPVLSGLIIVSFHYLVAGTLFASLEGRTPFDSIYWANTTLTTVGYGDFVPHLALTKLEAMETAWAGTLSVALIIVAFVEKALNARESKLNATYGLSDDVEEVIAQMEKDHHDVGVAIAKLKNIDRTMRLREKHEKLEHEKP